MNKDLTNSALDRQNILNNPYAVAEIEKAAGIHGVPFEGKTVVLKEQVAAFFEVTPRTIDNYIEKYSDELRQNGYEVLRGNQLKELKIEIQKHFGHEMDFVTKSKELLGEWMKAVLHDDEDDEILKLKIFNAISKGAP
jgi:hypothetical protein